MTGGYNGFFAVFDLSSEVQKNMGCHDSCGHEYVIRGTLSLEEIKSRAFLRDWLDGRKKCHKIL